MRIDKKLGNLREIIAPHKIELGGKGGEDRPGQMLLPPRATSEPPQLEDRFLRKSFHGGFLSSSRPITNHNDERNSNHIFEVNF